MSATQTEEERLATAKMWQPEYYNQNAV
jgi:dynein light chain LC8-type